VSVERVVEIATWAEWFYRTRLKAPADTVETIAQELGTTPEVVAAGVGEFVRLLELLDAYDSGVEHATRTALTSRPFLSPYDVEKRLNLGSKIVARLIKSGEIKSFEIAKGHRRIDPEELERYIAERRSLFSSPGGES